LIHFYKRFLTIVYHGLMTLALGIEKKQKVNELIIHA